MKPIGASSFRLDWRALLLRVVGWVIAILLVWASVWVWVLWLWLGMDG